MNRYSPTGVIFTSTLVNENTKLLMDVGEQTKHTFIVVSFQACVLALSLVLVVAFGWYYTGGPAEIFKRAEENGRIELFK